MAEKNLSLAHPEMALSWIDDAVSCGHADLSSLKACDVFVLVALAAAARKKTLAANSLKANTLEDAQEAALNVAFSAEHAVGRFAHALHFDDVISSDVTFVSKEKARTVALARFTKHDRYEQAASKIAKLIFPEKWPLNGEEEARQTLRYVLIELFRNVNQHSHDKFGGVVAAQIHKDGWVQMAIADSGIGISKSLSGMHPSFNTPAAALNRAICAHISGSFAEGETGGGQNAGMGLFFISEITKLVGGTLLVVSRGDALLLKSNPDEIHDNDLKTLNLGYQGTLVVFSLLPKNVGSFDGILETVNKRARRYTPQKETLLRWFSFTPAPKEALHLLISVASEDTDEAERFAKETLEVQLLKRRALVLNFQNLSVCTQSFLHALLYEPVRLAWALKVPVHIIHVTSAVQSGLRLLENYALAA